MDLRQKQENEENYQRMLREEIEKKEADARKKIYLMGKFDPTLRGDFVLIPPEYIIEIMQGNNLYLREEAFNAFLKMHNLAKINGLNIKIASATRNFNYQKDIWNDQWTGVKIVSGQNLTKSFPDEEKRFKKILEYIAAPSTSRHHWGTDIDINAANVQYFKTELGRKEYQWLIKNAPLFGFCQTYNLKGSERSTGYNEEKWHWSYLPLSKDFTKEYARLIKNEDIQGFFGEEYVPSFDLINDYVLSINKECI